MRVKDCDIICQGKLKALQLDYTRAHKRAPSISWLPTHLYSFRNLSCMNALVNVLSLFTIKDPREHSRAVCITKHIPWRSLGTMRVGQGLSHKKTPQKTPKKTKWNFQVKFPGLNAHIINEMVYEKNYWLKSQDSCEYSISLMPHPVRKIQPMPPSSFSSHIHQRLKVKF